MMRMPSELTQARQEIAVLDAIAKLKQASITQLKKEIGLAENAIRWTLNRQQGISVERVGPGVWVYLPEPGDQPLPELTISQQKDILFENWMEAQGIEHEGVFLKKRHRYYLKSFRFDELEIGQIVAVGKAFMRIHRIEVMSSGHYRLWEKHAKTPSRKGKPEDLIISRITPNPKLYLTPELVNE